MIEVLIGKMAPWLLGALAVVAAALGYGARQKAKGRKDATTDALVDAVKRQGRGRDAVSDIRGADRNGLIERVRDNDSRW